MVSEGSQSSEECLALTVGSDYILTVTTVINPSLRAGVTTHHFHHIMFLNDVEESLRLCDNHSE